LTHQEKHGAAHLALARLALANGQVSKHLKNTVKRLSLLAGSSSSTQHSAAAARPARLGTYHVPWQQDKLINLLV
jgi:hypothetical protein